MGNRYAGKQKLYICCIKIEAMDYIFVPLGDFMLSTFPLIEQAGNKFNFTLIAVGALLTSYWFYRIITSKTDKGVFRK